MRQRCRLCRTPLRGLGLGRNLVCFSDRMHHSRVVCLNYPTWLLRRLGVEGNHRLEGLVRAAVVRRPAL